MNDTFNGTFRNGSSAMAAGAGSGPVSAHTLRWEWNLGYISHLLSSWVKSKWATYTSTDTVAAAAAHTLNILRYHVLEWNYLKKKIKNLDQNGSVWLKNDLWGSHTISSLSD